MLYYTQVPYHPFIHTVHYRDTKESARRRPNHDTNPAIRTAVRLPRERTRKSPAGYVDRLDYRKYLDYVPRLTLPLGTTPSIGMVFVTNL